MRGPQQSAVSESDDRLFGDRPVNADATGCCLFLQSFQPHSSDADCDFLYTLPMPHAIRITNACYCPRPKPTLCLAPQVPWARRVDCTAQLPRAGRSQGRPGHAGPSRDTWALPAHGLQELGMRALVWGFSFHLCNLAAVAKQVRKCSQGFLWARVITGASELNC